ncbi:MAG: hypothetical protein KF788_20905 [Piscinibacter sp.]|nr:hypothetical protein [Piscinibacter sp.]
MFQNPWEPLPRTGRLRRGEGKPRGAGKAAAIAGALLLFAGEAQAQAQAQAPALVLGQTLALAGAVGGLVLGAAAGIGRHGGLGLWPSFGIHLGFLCLLASTRFGSLEVVPLTLVLGAIAGVLPFVACFLAMRAALRRWRAPRPPAP